MAADRGDAGDGEAVPLWWVLAFLALAFLAVAGVVLALGGSLVAP